MKPRTQLLLYRLFWLGERILRPTTRNAITSFGEWASREGLWRDIRRLEARALLETESGQPRMERVIRLTEKGRLAALGGYNPPDRWDRGWDGQWRVLCFDIPEARRSNRATLRKRLREARFGTLQKSVWVSPDSLAHLAAGLQEAATDCGVLMAFEGASCLGENNAEIVAAAWDFQKVADAYAAWRCHADSLPAEKRKPEPARILDWGGREQALWADCMAADPLLPRSLWPAGYEGESAWKHRLNTLSQAAAMLLP